MTSALKNKRLIIVGGGVGGLLLSRFLNSFDITIFEQSNLHVFQPSWLYTAIYGRRESARPIKSLIPKNVKFVNEEIIKVNLDNRFVESKTKKYEYDLVTMATGATPDPSKIPGVDRLAEQFGNLNTNETLALRTWSNLSKFNGGKLVIGLSYPIYKFPPVALEATFLIDEYLRKRKIRDKTELTFFSPFLGAYPARPMDEVIQPLLKEKGINVISPFDLDVVDFEKRTLTSLEGDALSYDLALVVPPHSGTNILSGNLVNEDGFISTDKQKLNIKGFDDAFAIGDVASIPAAKSGATTHLQARVLAKRLKGIDARYDGRTNCPFEVGNKKATFVIGNYEYETVKLQPKRSYYYMKKLFNMTYWSTIKGKNEWVFDWYFDRMNPKKLKEEKKNKF